jgi:hypothetical protein
MHITPAERQRLAAILGMLGSEHAGERAAAGLQAEAFRRKHGLTWAELLALPEMPAASEPPAWAPEPAAAPPTPKDVSIFPAALTIYGVVVLALSLVFINLH